MMRVFNIRRSTLPGQAGLQYARTCTAGLQYRHLVGFAALTNVALTNVALTNVALTNVALTNVAPLHKHCDSYYIRNRNTNTTTDVKNGIFTGLGQLLPGSTNS